MDANSLRKVISWTARVAGKKNWRPEIYPEEGADEILLAKHLAVVPLVTKES